MMRVLFVAVAIVIIVVGAVVLPMPIPLGAIRATGLTILISQSPFVARQVRAFGSEIPPSTRSFAARPCICRQRSAIFCGRRTLDGLCAAGVMPGLGAPAGAGDSWGSHRATVWHRVATPCWHSRTCFFRSLMRGWDGFSVSVRWALSDEARERKSRIARLPGV